LLAVNLKGTFNTLRAASKRLRPGGRIINFSSSVAGLALPGYSVYAATESAVETMTNIFAKELRGRNITVNAVAPGPRPQICSSTARRTSRPHIPPSCRRSNASVSPTTSQTWFHSSPARMPAGSTARRCAPTAAWFDSDFTEHKTSTLNKTRT
jgi:3-oxoacyl-[acyl-carrier protein] reductase